MIAKLIVRNYQVCCKELSIFGYRLLKLSLHTYCIKMLGIAKNCGYSYLVNSLSSSLRLKGFSVLLIYKVASGVDSLSYEQTGL